MGRSLLIFTLAFAAGIAIGVYISFPAGPLLIAAALIIAALSFSRLFVTGTGRGRYSPSRPEWSATVGLLLLVFMCGMAYVVVRGAAARGSVAALLAGPNGPEGQEATIEGTIIREPDIREGRTAYIVRVQTVNGSQASGLILVVDYRKESPPSNTATASPPAAACNSPKPPATPASSTTPPTWPGRGSTLA